MSIFQKEVLFCSSNRLSWQRTTFSCPRVYAKDGFSVSLQIGAGKNCKSENGYKQLGDSFSQVEFGYPNLPDEDFKEYAENEDDICHTAGSIPISVLERIFEKHGGIDWEKTISKDAFNSLVNAL